MEVGTDVPKEVLYLLLINRRRSKFQRRKSTRKNEEIDTWQWRLNDEFVMNENDSEALISRDDSYYTEVDDNVKI